MLSRMVADALTCVHCCLFLTASTCAGHWITKILVCAHHLLSSSVSNSSDDHKQNCCCCWSLLYITILHSRADSLRLHVILLEWIAFYSAFFTVHRSVVLTHYSTGIELKQARKKLTDNEILPKIHPWPRKAWNLNRKEHLWFYHKVIKLKRNHHGSFTMRNWHCKKQIASFVESKKLLVVAGKSRVSNLVTGSKNFKKEMQIVHSKSKIKNKIMSSVGVKHLIKLIVMVRLVL